jgi:hypothetical protein
MEDSVLIWLTTYLCHDERKVAQGFVTQTCSLLLLTISETDRYHCDMTSYSPVAEGNF